MKTKNKKLTFSKSSVLELNGNQMQSIKGGASTLIYPSIIATITDVINQSKNTLCNSDI